MKAQDLTRFLVTKVLHIDPEERYRRQPRNLVETARGVVGENNVYLDDEPTAGEWLRGLVPTKQGVAHYMHELFPFAGWIPRYSLPWLMGDVIAGMTVGFVVVPQAMAYALLARLSPEYGLYTSFVGAATYWLFGTSRDIVIGTTAVGSLLVGSAVTAVEEQRPGEYTAAEVSTTLSLLAGIILLGIGLLRLGWIVDFIPYISISAFVTAAAITIMSTQVPVALGIDGVNTREAPIMVIVNTLKSLDRTNLDAAIGITCIVFLFALRDLCSWMETRQPSHKRVWGALSSLRFTFTIMLYTLISYLVNRNLSFEDSKFKIVGTIDPGFRKAGAPTLQPELASLILSELPAVLIILVIEHIAIAKSFGRIFGYKVIPSQEIMAQGAANLFSPFIGGYVCTGSFGASAVLSKAGVRTPLAGLVSALVLVLALYALTPVFYFIPRAALAGLIIHATSNLLTPPRSLYKYWQLSPLELLIWVVGFFIAVFESLEMSIYVTIGMSLGLLLIRLARTRGTFMGRVQTYLASINDEPADSHELSELSSASRPEGSGSNERDACETTGPLGPRDKYLPLDRCDGSNPSIEPQSPYPGVFIYRFRESFNYTNQAQHVDRLLTYITDQTSRTSPEDPELKPSDRLWNDPGPVEKGKHPASSASSVDASVFVPEKPFLRAVVLDCSTINNIDVTSVQGLVDLRTILDRHAQPEAVEWHLASVQNRWTRRALTVAGFGYPAADVPAAVSGWTPTYAVAGSVAGAEAVRLRRPEGHAITDEEKRAGGGGEVKEVPRVLQQQQGENGGESSSSREQSPDETQGRGSGREGMRPVYGVDRPFFHIDLQDAVEVAVRNARKKDAMLAERQGEGRATE